MANRANITSVEAIEDFRANLIVYLSKAKPTLDEIGSEVARTRGWVQDTQMTHYAGLLKKRGHVLEEARAAVFSAKISSFRDAASAEQLALAKAKRAYDEVEQKMRVIRRWGRDFDNKVEPLVKQLEKLNTILADDLTQAVQYLTEIKKLMDDYTGVAPPSITSGDPPPVSVSGDEPETTVAPAKTDGTQPVGTEQAEANVPKEEKP